MPGGSSFFEAALFRWLERESQREDQDPVLGVLKS